MQSSSTTASASEAADIDAFYEVKLEGIASRWGVTPPETVDPMAFAILASELQNLGYTDIWSSETDQMDAFSPLAAAASHATLQRLGTAIASVFTRGPALLAMSAAALAWIAPDRFTLGIGSSSPAIVSGWNGIPFDRPYSRTRDLLRFLRIALRGDRVDQAFDTFTVGGFRLACPPPNRVPIFIAALLPRMLRLARDEADGVIINWLSVDDVPRVRAEAGGEIEIVARIFVIPTDDADVARTAARRAITTYLSTDTYAAFHRWLGHGQELELMQKAWNSGDRAGANALLPDSLVDSLVVHGTPKACRDHIRSYIEAGVTTPVISLLANPTDPADALRSLSPCLE